MVKYERLIWHCTATKKGKDYEEKTVRRWFRERGWSKVGYALIVRQDGSVMKLQNFDNDKFISYNELTYGVAGWNANARHFSYFGGVDTNGYPKDTRTDAQKTTMEILTKQQILMHPDIKVGGHNQYAAKACPSFYVPDWARSVGIEDKHIEHIQQMTYYVGKNLFDF